MIEIIPTVLSVLTFIVIVIGGIFLLKGGSYIVRRILYLVAFGVAALVYVGSEFILNSIGIQWVLIGLAVVIIGIMWLFGVELFPKKARQKRIEKFKELKLKGLERAKNLEDPGQEPEDL